MIIRINLKLTPAQYETLKQISAGQVESAKKASNQMTQPQIELLPCPFCGGHLTYNSQGIVEESRIDSWVGCETCGMRGPSERTYYEANRPDVSKAAMSKMRQASVDKWNAIAEPRSSPPAAPGLRDGDKLISCRAVVALLDVQRQEIRSVGHLSHSIRNLFDDIATKCAIQLANPPEIAAAQGGQVVDRLRDLLREAFTTCESRPGTSFVKIQNNDLRITQEIHELLIGIKE